MLSMDDRIAVQVAFSSPWNMMLGALCSAAVPSLTDTPAKTGMIAMDRLTAPRANWKICCPSRTAGAADAAGESGLKEAADPSPGTSTAWMSDALSEAITWPYASTFATAKESGSPGDMAGPPGAGESTLSAL